MVCTRRTAWWTAITLIVFFALVPSSAAPQAAGAGPDGILILSQDRLFSDSLYGQRVQATLEAAGAALTAENRRIEAQLTDEELRLTGQRPTMDPAEFRLLADEFDTRVREIRATQDAKAQSLAAQADAAQQHFFELAVPVLLQIVQERGAAVILDNRAVLLSAETVDITSVAMTRINEEIGDGGGGSLLLLPMDPVPPIQGPAEAEGGGDRNSPTTAP
ncbi:MAG: OmpH family outer membrane protein [Rhodobacteraceae bacterium]|nr:OmpH family outer membrane protein [Paracoccaceae bacterium]